MYCIYVCRLLLPRLPPLSSAFCGTEGQCRIIRRGVAWGLRRKRGAWAVRSPAAVRKDEFFAILSELLRPLLTKLAEKHHNIWPLLHELCYGPQYVINKFKKNKQEAQIRTLKTGYRVIQWFSKSTRLQAIHFNLFA